MRVSSRRVLARGAAAVRGTSPGNFAVVMATGIVSVALRQVGQVSVSAVLLVITAAAFVILVAAFALRAAAFPADLSRDLARPDRAFTSFAFVAACDVLGSRLADDRHTVAAIALAAAALAAWLALTWLVPGRMAARRVRRPVITDVGGSWYLWAVATQSLAIAAAFLGAGRVIAAQPAALTAITVWSAGAVLYLATCVVVAVRLLRAGLGPDEPTAPYWVAMGAASITVLAAAQILRGPGSPAANSARPVLSGLAIAFWGLASALIPPLIARSVLRHLRPGRPLRYRPDLWMIVFPAGMYATASMQIGTATGLAFIHRVGTVAAWPAAAAWALTFVAMVASSRLAYA